MVVNVKTYSRKTEADEGDEQNLGPGMRVEANNLGRMRLEAQLLFFTRHGSFFVVDILSCIVIGLVNSRRFVVGGSHALHLV